MKKQLTKKIINKYISDEFGNISNPLTKNEMKKLIDNDKLTLEGVKLWKLFGGDLMIKGCYGRTILHSASYKGQLDIVEYVLDKCNEIKNIDIDCLDNINQTPLIYASSKGQIKVINLLLEKGANINHQNSYKWSALHYTCELNKLEIVKLLVEKGIDIQLKGHYINNIKTALDVANYKKYQQIVDYLTPFYNNNN